MKKIATIVVSMLYVSGLSAQTQYRSEWNIHAGAGNTMYKFDSDKQFKGTAVAAIGGSGGVDYACFFSRYVGVSVGLEAAIYNRLLDTPSARNDEETIETPTGLAGNFFLRTNYDGIEDKLTATFLQFPLMLHLQIPISQKNYFYLAAGGKYAIPLAASNKQTISTVTTTGYSDYTKITYRDMPNHGFETLQDVQTTEKLTLKSSLLPAFEAGFKWNNWLRTGVYVDMNYTIGFKLGFAIGTGHLIVKKEPPVKPAPLLGD
ncbi:hypothetical protein AGMMS49965_05510 [Bacteroidia bacterium]|nr:hypothetical protein AGMMS49965_05510 [Bacteroidia bacterium]